MNDPKKITPISAARGWRPPDFLNPIHPGIEARSTAPTTATTMPSTGTALSSTMPTTEPWTHPNPLPADALIPVDGPPSWPTPEAMRTILRSPRLHAVLAAAERLGWPNLIWPGFLTREERNDAIRKTCADAGVHPNALPSNRSIERFYAVLLS